MFNLNKALLAKLVAIAAAMTCGSVAVRASSLEETLARVYTNNTDIRAAQAGLRARDELVPQAYSSYMPNISISGQSGAANTRSWPPDGRDNTNIDTRPGSYAVTVRQTLFDFGRAENRVQSSINSVLAARASYENFVQQTLFLAVQRYMDVVRYTAILKLRESNVELLKRQFDFVTYRFNIGELTKTDVALVQAQMASANADLIDGRADLDLARVLYRQVAGQDAEDFSDATPVITHLPKTVEEAYKIGEAEAPSLTASRYVLEAAKASKNAIAAQFLPIVSLVGSYSKTYNNITPGIEGQDSRILAQLTIPLYDGGISLSQLRAAKETVAQREIEYDDARGQVRANIQNAWSLHQTAKARVGAISAQIDAATTALAGTQAEADVGQRTTLDVLTATQNKLLAEVNLVTAHRDYVVTSYQILFAMGRLSPTRLGLDVVVYDPESHFDLVKWQVFGGNVSQVE